MGWHGSGLRRGLNTIREMVARRHQSPTKEWPLVFVEARRAARDSRMAGRNVTAYDVAKFERQSGRPLNQVNAFTTNRDSHRCCRAGCDQADGRSTEMFESSGPAPRRVHFELVHRAASVRLDGLLPIPGW